MPNVGDIVGDIKNSVSNAVNNVVTTVQNTAGNIQQNVQGEINIVKDAVQEGIDSIKNTLNPTAPVDPIVIPPKFNPAGTQIKGGLDGVVPGSGNFDENFQTDKGIMTTSALSALGLNSWQVNQNYPEPDLTEASKPLILGLAVAGALLLLYFFKK